MFILTKDDKIQINDTTIITYPNNGGYLLQFWFIKCNDKNIAGKFHNFIRSTKTNSPTGKSAATTLPANGESFMYTETSAKNQLPNVYSSFQKTDIIRIRNIS